MKLKYASIIFSIVGILVLYSISKLSQPPLIAIEEMPNYEGKQVTVEGIVTDYYSTKYGSQVITIGENNASTKAFVEGKISVEFGDKIRITGEIQRYKEEWTLVVDDVLLVKILEKWDNISFPLWQLAENPTRYLNLNVNVTGHIEHISNSNFHLVDLEKKHSLLVVYSYSKNISIYPGQLVSASGKLTFDEENFRYQLEMYDEKHKITYLQKE